MANHQFKTNPNWKKYEKLKKGDIVKLKINDGFSHLVKLTVKSVDKDDVKGKVDAVFDWHTKEQIIGGNILDLVGKEVSFTKDFIFDVIEKPGNLQ